jgi:hypothetical protein
MYKNNVYVQKEKMEYCIVLEFLLFTLPLAAAPPYSQGCCSCGCCCEMLKRLGIALDIVI